MTLLFVTVFGLLIGSFLNVCIWRIPRQLSVMDPARSFCPACKKQLTWAENIPIFSWIFLGAKCKSCRAPISGQYPFVEMLSGVAAAASYIYFGLTVTGVVVYALLAVFIVISFIDLEFKIIPDVINFPGIVIGLCIGILSQYSDLFAFPLTQGAFDSLLGFVLGGCGFWFVTYLYLLISGKIGLGGGDIKFMAFLGAILGWKAILPTIFAGCLFGTAVGLPLMLVSKAGRNTEIPFGPFLVVGAVFHMFSVTSEPFFRLHLW